MPLEEVPDTLTAYDDDFSFSDDLGLV